jgi:hypothetical protein
MVLVTRNDVVMIKKNKKLNLKSESVRMLAAKELEIVEGAGVCSNEGTIKCPTRIGNPGC